MADISIVGQKMFAVVEKFIEDGRAVFTCIAHTPEQGKAEKERDQWAIPEYPLDEAFSYWIVEFERGEPCPHCGRNFEF